MIRSEPAFGSLAVEARIRHSANAASGSSIRHQSSTGAQALRRRKDAPAEPYDTLIEVDSAPEFARHRRQSLRRASLHSLQGTPSSRRCAGSARVYLLKSSYLMPGATAPRASRSTAAILPGQTGESHGLAHCELRPLPPCPAAIHHF